MTTVQRIAEKLIEEWPCTLASWFFVVMPAEHPLWNRYLLSLITLADMSGQPPANKVSPAMTHELLLVALNPEHRPSANDPSKWQIMTPVNYVYQFASQDDSEAIGIGEVVAALFARGQCLFEIQGIFNARELNDRRIQAAIENARAQE